MQGFGSQWKIMPSISIRLVISMIYILREPSRVLAFASGSRYMINGASKSIARNTPYSLTSHPFVSARR
jgi:hypothetical protein